MARINKNTLDTMEGMLQLALQSFKDKDLGAVDRYLRTYNSMAHEARMQDSGTGVTKFEDVLIDRLLRVVEDVV